jgi:hypothetical protein|nr:hypothetical protein [Bradyrhizobium sp.]
MSSVGSEIGGKAAGGENVNQQQYPFFTSPGGVTPQQGALAEYDYGQNLTEGQAQFGGGDEGGGNALSTMASQVAGGANIGKALNLAGSSDANQGADYSAFGNAINIDQQNNENLLAENEQNLQNATSLASLAGSAAGGQAGATTHPSTT